MPTTKNVKTDTRLIDCGELEWVRNMSDELKNQRVRFEYRKETVMIRAHCVHRKSQMVLRQE